MVDVDVGDELTRLRTNVAEGEDRLRAEGLLDIEVEVEGVGGAQIGVDGEEVVVGVGIVGSSNREQQRIRSDDDVAVGKTGHGGGAAWVAFGTGCSTVGRAVVEEGIKVGLVEEHANAAAEDKARAERRLIGKAYAGTEVIKRPGEERADLGSLEG